MKVLLNTGKYYNCAVYSPQPAIKQPSVKRNLVSEGENIYTQGIYTKPDSVIGDILYYSIMNLLKAKINNPRFDTFKLKSIEKTMEQNKDEIQRVLRRTFYIMKQKHNYDFGPSKIDYSKWKPSMGEKDAEEYVKMQNRMASNRTLYRASASPERAKKIGYDISRIGPYYPGIYIASTAESASLYSNNKPLKLKARMDNVVGCHSFELQLFNAFKQNTDNEEILDALWEIRGVVEHSFAKKLNIDAFCRILQAFDEDEPADAYAVINPKNIVIIDENL